MKNIIDLLNSTEGNLREAEKNIRLLESLDLADQQSNAKELLVKYTNLRKLANEKRDLLIQILATLLIVSGNKKFFLPVAGFNLSIISENEFRISGASGPSEKDCGVYTSEKLANWIHPINFQTFCNDALVHITKDVSKRMKVAHASLDTNSSITNSLIEISDKIKGILTKAQ